MEQDSETPEPNKLSNYFNPVEDIDQSQILDETMTPTPKTPPKSQTPNHPPQKYNHDTESLNIASPTPDPNQHLPPTHNDHRFLTQQNPRK